MEPTVRTQNSQNTRKRVFSAGSACSAYLVFFASTAAAQAPAPATSPVTQGPMVVERMHNGFVFAPDVKLTEVDKKASALAGGYAGWLTDDTIFFGGGGYWLANQASDRKMAYGGFVAQWFTRSDRTVGFGVKGLVGGGQATLGSTLTEIFGFPPPTTRLPDLLNDPRLSRIVGDLHPLPIGGATTLTTRFRQREAFFIAEPEVDVVVKLSKQLRLTGGVGYRFIDAEARNDNRLRGATGSIALQFRPGS
jgi:hypothetical protein